jgi:hypothetical protein
MKKAPMTTAPLLALLVLPAVLAAQSPSRSASPLTRPESTAYRETSRYEDVQAFLAAVTRGHRRLHLTTMGYSMEGRALPLVVAGHVPEPTAEAVRRSGRLRVFVQGNIHAGEVEGKEAALLLLRALAAGRHAAWLDSLVLLIAPIYNADGNERIALTNRPGQNGPLGGMGQRPNAQGLDLNRDHMKLAAPEARSFVALLNAYDPHVTIDLHTTNGSIHAYHLTYETALHPGTDRALVELARTRLFPAVTRRVRERDGWEFFFYGNLPGGPVAAGATRERGWYTFDYRPRFNNNYVGLRNRLAILSEAYSYASFEERIRATVRFVEETLDFVRAHAGEIRRLTEAADARSLAGDSLPLRARLHRGERPLEVLIGAVSETRHPLTGQRIFQRQDVRRPETMADFSTFEGVEFERVPAAYFIPAALTQVLDRLEAHGIRFTRLDAPLTVAVEQFRVDSSTQAEQPFQNHRERTITGRYERADVTLPAGTVVVRTAQPLGRLAFYLLEPRSDDGLLNWNFFDEWLARTPGMYPVVRTFATF